MAKTQELNSYLVLKKRNRILLLKRFNEIWEFSGGGVEFKEHPKEAAIRETIEETGLKAKNLRILGATSATFKVKGREKHAVYVVYLSKSFSGKLKLSREHTEHRWCTIQETKNLNLGLNVKPVIKML